MYALSLANTVIVALPHLEGVGIGAIWRVVNHLKLNMSFLSFANGINVWFSHLQHISKPIVLLEYPVCFVSLLPYSVFIARGNPKRERSGNGGKSFLASIVPSDSCA